MCITNFLSGCNTTFTNQNSIHSNYFSTGLLIPIRTFTLLLIETKLLIYKAVIKPIWSYGIELWCCASKSNIVFMQRSQSKILRAIANAPWYVTNHTLHTDFNVPYVSEFKHERINNHHNNLEAHPNPLLEPLLQPTNTRRLKRC
jgi:hypothetical protein